MLSRRTFTALGGLVAASFTSVGCKRATPSTPAETELVVFAAASLRDAFTDMGGAFERAHPGVEVTFNFAGTQELRTQIEHGARADVMASADERHMDALLKAGHVAAPVAFARNEPVIVVAAEAAETVRALADLPKATRIVLGADSVPIGRYALALLAKATTALGPGFRARVEANVVSRELNVRQALAKVSLGEAQAGIVYRTDVRDAGDRLRVVPIPADVNVVATYPIAVVSDAPHPRSARAWVDFVLSAAGQQALASAGFLPAQGGNAP